MRNFCLLFWLSALLAGTSAFAQTALTGIDGSVYTMSGGYTDAPDDQTLTSYSPSTGAITTVNSTLPWTKLCLVAPDGSFYAIASTSPIPQILRITTAGAATVFATFPFDTDDDDDINSLGCPTIASDGNYYGSSDEGGAYGHGFFYQLTPSGAISDIYDFTGTFDGNAPAATALQAGDGSLYFYTGANLLRFSASSGLSVIPAASQNYLDSGIVQASDGNFYAAFAFDGSAGLERITTLGNVDAIYSNTDDYPYVLSGPFLQGDGNLALVEAITYNNVCEEGDTLVFYPVTVAGQMLTPTAQIGITSQESPTTYNPDPVYLSGNGNYYGTVGVEGWGQQPSGECTVGAASVITLNLTPSPAPTPPISFSFSKTHMIPGGSSTLTWKVNNAYSDTMQQCYGYGGAPESMAGLGKVALSGSMTVKLTTAQTYQASIVCGGTETNFASVTAGNATITVIASATTIPSGAGVTLTGQITNVGTPVPTGSIKFYSGSLLIGSGALNSSGVATLTASTAGIPPGSYSVTANYAGDANYGAATSSAITVTVVAKSATTLSLSPASQTAVKGGANPTFIAIATGHTSGEQPTGSVSFLFGSTVLAIVALQHGVSNSTASFSPSVTDVSPGTYTISASYAGDNWNNGSDSNSVQVTVQADSVTVAASPNPVPASTAFTLTATAAGSVTPTGTVVFYAGNTGLGSNTLSSGTASISVAAGTLSAGSYSITAHYAGDKNNPAVISPPITLTVQ